MQRTKQRISPYATEELARLMGLRHWTGRYRGARVALKEINVLPQPRRTFENIEGLADDIAQKGIMKPPLVAAFDAQSCAEHLKVVNHLWETKHAVSDLVPGSDGTFYVLLAGECRLRAFQRLWQNGCSECRDTYGVESEGICYRRHFDDDAVEVRLADRIYPLPGLFRQFAENTHQRVPAHEEAEAYARLFRLIRFYDPLFTVAQFARQVNRSSEMVRNAIRFCDLPASVQEVVGRGQVPYGIAVELSRLHQEHMSEEDLHWWLQRAIASNATVKSFADMVTGYLKDRASGQQSLEGIMDEEQQKLNKRLKIRQTVELESIRGLWAFLYYFQKVLALFESGALGKDDSPFSAGSPARVFRIMVKKQLRLLPHLRDLVPKQDYNRAARILERAERLSAANPAAHQKDEPQ